MFLFVLECPAMISFTCLKFTCCYGTSYNCKIVKEQIQSNKRNLFCKLHLLQEQIAIKLMLNAFIYEMKSNVLSLESVH